MGDKVVRLPEEIHREMRKNQIALEVQDTVSLYSIRLCFLVKVLRWLVMLNLM